MSTDESALLNVAITSLLEATNALLTVRRIRLGITQSQLSDPAEARRFLANMPQPDKDDSPEMLNEKFVYIRTQLRSWEHDPAIQSLRRELGDSEIRELTGITKEILLIAKHLVDSNHDTEHS